MANGKQGDHPITDITYYGMSVFGEEADRLIAELAADGRSREIDTEIDLWTRLAEPDLVEQLKAIAARRHPSVLVKIDWASAFLEEHMAPSYGPGWSLTASVVMSDPADGDSPAWTMRLHISRFYLGSADKDVYRALARFISDSAPWAALTPGARFWIRSAHRTSGFGTVVTEDEYYQP